MSDDTREERKDRMIARFRQNTLVKRATVRLVCYRTNAAATGILLEDQGNIYLYTCWHFFADLNFLDIKVTSGSWPPVRTAISMHFPDIYEIPEGLMQRGDFAAVEIALYDDNNIPLWEQEQREKPYPDLNGVGVHVPRFIDAVRIDVTKLLDERAWEHIVLPKSMVSSRMAFEGGDLLVFGYPHGFSAAGKEAVVPVCIKRSIASSNVPREFRGVDLLLDGCGFPGMSGSPVFLDDDDSLHLVGLYTGALFMKDGQAADRLGMVTGFQNLFQDVCFKTDFVPTP